MSIQNTLLQEPTYIRTDFTSVEDMFKWFASNKP